MAGSRFSRLVLSLALLSSPARALGDAAGDGERTYIGPEIVVTAARIEWPVGKTAGFITILTADDIRARRAENVADALRSVPSLAVARSGSAGKATSVFVRGAASNHVLVMLDGVPLNDPATGAFDFSDLSTAGVERIEIVRGPHGVLYGSSAIGGVVNIITHAKRAGARRSFTAAAGSFGSAEGAVSISGGAQSHSYAYTLAGFTTDGRTENDFHRRGGFSGAVSTAVTEASDVSLSLRYDRVNTGLGGPRFDFDPNARQGGGSIVAAATYRQIVSGAWSHEIRTSFLYREITWDDPVDPAETGPFSGDAFSEIGSNAASVVWQNNLRLRETIWITAGTEWKEERTTNSGYTAFGTTSFDDHIRNASAFLSCIADRPGLPTLSAGVRLDDHSEFGSAATYRCAASYPLPRAGTTMKASVGTGFRAPSLNELYYPGYGNPALAPEHSRGWDCGARQELIAGRASVEASYFSNTYRDMISFDFATYLAGNVGEAASDGVELRASLRPLARVGIEGHYAYTRTEDRSTGAWLLRRPRHGGGAAVTVTAGPVETFVSASFVGRRLDNDFGGPLGEHFTSAHALLDAAISWRPARGVEVFCRGGNILDERYDEVAGYPSPGRSLATGSTVAF
jgi:vitamin B12 transporter